MSESTQRPDLSIIIVNFNGGALLDECLRSLQECPHDGSWELVFVENGSTDGSAKYLQERFPDAVYVENKKNLGLAKAFNQGLAVAKGRHLLSLDNDTTVLPGSLTAMVRFLDEHPETGACGVRLLDPDGTIQKTARLRPTALNAVFGRRSLVTKFYPDNPFSKKYLMDHKLSADEPFEVDWLTTACLMVRREAVEKCGGLDEVFFVYWVDADWCDRIKRGGWKIYCLPGHQIIHNENLKGKRQKGRRSAKMVIDFHLGAYHYYKNNRAPHTMNPMRWIAAAGLAARGASILAWDVLRQYLPRK